MFDALRTPHSAHRTIQMDKIGNIIGIRLNQHKLGESARASEVIYKANEYLCKTLKCEADDVRACQLKNGILWVRVGNATWGQEVWGVTSLLLKTLHNEYGSTLVKRIRTMSKRNDEMFQ
ncbi:hypothetical protein JW758_02295 [Candidatus Peregrinibacteria bacterium]|nr:hypothetical protein [Candidatus Peregrinibacteria bacterium]